MCPIRQLMSSMRAQLSLGKDKQSQSAQSWSPHWPFPALFKTTTVPLCDQRISKWQKLLFPHYFSHTTECILHKKAVLLLHQTQTGWTVSHVPTELIHLFFPLISIFCWSGISWREIDWLSSKQLCCLRSVSETVVNKPQHSGLRINALCLRKPWRSRHTDSPVDHTAICGVCGPDILLKGTKTGHGTTNLPDGGWSASPEGTQVWIFWRIKKEKENSNCRQLQAERYSQRLRFIMFVP